MKELSIEQKAKAYDEALKWMRDLYPNLGIAAKEKAESIFPELRGSEDEKVRKEITELVMQPTWKTEKEFYRRKELVDWIEKQGKQKLALSEEDEEIRKWIINEIKIKHHKLDEDNVDFVDKAIAWLEKQCKETSWKPSKEEMDVLYGLAYITNQCDEHKEEIITRLYQDLKREFFNSSSYENMFPNTQDGVRRRSTIQVLEYARSLDNYNQYGKADIDKNIAWLEKQGKEDSSIQQAYEWGYTEGKRIERKHWIEKQSEQNPIFNADDWYVSKVDGKIHNIYHSVDKVEPKFNVGDWIIDNKNRVGIIVRILDEHYIVSFDGREVQISFEWEGKLFRKWAIQDAKDGDVLCYKDEISLYKHDIKNCTKQETTFGGFVYHCCYDGKRFITDSLYSLTEQDKMDIHPATKEQRDLLSQKMKEAGYEWDSEKKELKKIEDEEYNGEDYGIDSLYHAQRILEKTLGSVDGYQTDDGILSHKCAITAVKKLYEQKPTWSDEDVYNSKLILSTINQDQDLSLKTKDKLTSWIKSIKQRIGI